MTPKLVLFLREYKVERERLYYELEEQLTLDDLVFTSVEGKPIDPCVLTHAFTRMVRQANLNGVRFHDLRHSSVAFTMDVYSHIIEGMQSNAMELLDEVLPAGVSLKNNG